MLSVAYIGPKSRTERHRKTKIGTEVAQVTRDSDTTFKVKKSRGHSRSPGRFLTAALTRQAAAAVTVGTYWPWEPTATLRSAGAVGSAARGASAPTEGEGAGVYCGGFLHSVFKNHCIVGCYLWVRRLDVKEIRWVTNRNFWNERIKTDTTSLMDSQKKNNEWILEKAGVTRTLLASK